MWVHKRALWWLQPLDGVDEKDNQHNRRPQETVDRLQIREMHEDHKQPILQEILTQLYLQLKDMQLPQPHQIQA